MISHTWNGRNEYIDMSSDQELDPNQLPRGHTPIWIQPPEDATDIEMMERVLKIPELKQYNNNVTVLYHDDQNNDEEVMKKCSKIGWKYIENRNIIGVEDQVVIVFNTSLYPETITRGINLLIIVTNKRFEYCKITH